MTTIQQSARAYERWLKQQLGADLVAKDLASKHKKMHESAFVFFRATYWRWAEAILDICPELADAPSVLAVGDIHLENYGTWRDAEGRLAWGVNDFDEAAEMPYVLDLVRLATSALLAEPAQKIAAGTACGAILQGYRQGLRAPKPISLDRDYTWLAKVVRVGARERAKFWKKIADARSKTAPKRYRDALAKAMPVPGLSIRTAQRSAGAGSLGRPRWIGVADWRGSPVVREAKALAMSAWAHVHAPKAHKIRAGEIANGRFHSLDPWYGIEKGLVVRRLSPNNRKIEAESGGHELFSDDMLQLMGFELANVHLGVADRRSAITRDLGRRKRGWLAEAAKRAAKACTRDFNDWRAGG
jgi:uncharacterized protein (DUF2252 family)